MKKSLCALIACVLTLNSFQCAFAGEHTAKDNLVKANLSKSEAKEIFGDSISLANSKVFIAKDVNLAKEIYNIDTNEEDAKMKKQGVKKTNEKIYVLESVTDDSKLRSSIRSTPEMHTIIHETVWNSPAKKLNSSRYGMKHWLDVGFSIALGSCSGLASTVATILGLNPSDFLPDYTSGDMLEKSESMIKREKWVQVKTKNGYLNAGRAIKEDIKIYIDLRTSRKVNGKLQPVRKSGTETRCNITKNYDSESKLKALASRMVVGDSVVSFYEDPWK